MNPTIGIKDDRVAVSSIDRCDASQSGADALPERIGSPSDQAMIHGQRQGVSTSGSDLADLHGLIPLADGLAAERDDPARSGLILAQSNTHKADAVEDDAKYSKPNGSVSRIGNWIYERAEFNHKLRLVEIDSQLLFI